MSAPQKPQLAPEQALTVQRAREALDAGTDKDQDPIYRLAYRVGALEHHVGELLALVAKLTGGDR